MPRGNRVRLISVDALIKNLHPAQRILFLFFFLSQQLFGFRSLSLFFFGTFRNRHFLKFDALLLQYVLPIEQAILLFVLIQSTIAKCLPHLSGLVLTGALSKQILGVIVHFLFLVSFLFKLLKKLLFLVLNLIVYSLLNTDDEILAHTLRKNGHIHSIFRLLNNYLLFIFILYILKPLDVFVPFKSDRLFPIRK